MARDMRAELEAWQAAKRLRERPSEALAFTPKAQTPRVERSTGPKALASDAEVLCDCLEALEAPLEAPPSSPVQGHVAALKPQEMLEAALEEMQALEPQRCPGAYSFQAFKSSSGSNFEALQHRTQPKRLRFKLLHLFKSHGGHGHEPRALRDAYRQRRLHPDALLPAERQG